MPKLGDPKSLRIKVWPKSDLLTGLSNQSLTIKPDTIIDMSVEFTVSEEPNTQEYCKCCGAAL